jgi:hypothetical protein
MMDRCHDVPAIGEFFISESIQKLLSFARATPGRPSRELTSERSPESATETPRKRLAFGVWRLALGPNNANRLARNGAVANRVADAGF